MSRYIDYDAIDYRNDRLHDKSEEFLSEVFYYEEDRNGYGTMNTADTPQTEDYDFRDEQEYNDRWQTDCGWK